MNLDELSRVMAHRTATRRETGKLGLAAAVLAALGAHGLADRVAAAPAGSLPKVPYCRDSMRVCMSAGSVHQSPGTRRVYADYFIHNADPSNRYAEVRVYKWNANQGLWIHVHTSTKDYIGGSYGGGYNTSVHGQTVGGGTRLTGDLTDACRIADSDKRYRMSVYVDGSDAFHLYGGSESYLRLNCGV